MGLAQNTRGHVCRHTRQQLRAEEQPDAVTMYPGVGHNSWTRTYDGTGMGTERADYDAFNMSIYDWMLQYTWHQFR